MNYHNSFTSLITHVDEGTTHMGSMNKTRPFDLFKLKAPEISCPIHQPLISKSTISVVYKTCAKLLGHKCSDNFIYRINNALDQPILRVMTGGESDTYYRQEMDLLEIGSVKKSHRIFFQ